MITLTQTVTKTFDTPESIVDFLRAASEDGLAKAGLTAGAAVRITDRTGITAGWAAGDVGIILAGATYAGHAHVLCATEAGQGLVLTVPLTALAPLA